MSHRSVSTQQFGEQLKMFMTPDELIDTTNKRDSEFYDMYDQKGRGTPRQQWEHPHSGEASVHGEEPFVRNRSLRQQKLDRLATMDNYRDIREKPYETMPPVELTHYGWGSRRPQLSQGHHRLAHAEAKKIPYLAVTHHVVR